ncbi:MAG: hypothetical protein ACR2JR_12325 [Rubrobacteraceae bacterium]
MDRNPYKRSLSGEIRRVPDLSPDEREEMLSLLAHYFENVSRTTFERDLSEKEWCILLTDGSGRIKGFSTMMLMRVEGLPVAAVYSGDTIIAREHWGESLLSKLWSRHAFALADMVRREEPGTRVYWFLVSSGYKTYRFLSTFFREFHPMHDRPAPPEARRVMDVLARARFPEEYDPERGVVRPMEAAPLRHGVAEITGRLSDPHVAFFAAANPGHARGEELVCLTELVPGNLTPAGCRMLGDGADTMRDRGKSEGGT